MILQFGINESKQKKIFNMIANNSHLHKIEINNSILFHADCFDVFPYILDKSVNLILCDLPYGTTWQKWDCILDIKKLWKEYNRIIADNGAIVLFSSQPFTTELINSNLKNYKYTWYWTCRGGSL